MDAIGSALQPIVDIAVPGISLFAMAAMFVEFVVLLATRRPVHYRGDATSILCGTIGFGVLFAANRFVYVTLMQWIYAHRAGTLGAGAAAWLVCFVVYDLMFYLSHRAGHAVRLLWCFHSVHHTALEMRLTTAIRGSMFDFLYLPWFFVWIPISGLHPSMILIIESASRVWGVVTHVSPRLVGKLGPLDRLLVTPSVHRVHHGKDVLYLDRNYGEVLLVWDYLFGSHQPEEHAPTFGVLKEIDADSFREIQWSPWTDLWADLRRAPDWRSRLRYLFDSPGWSHDGPDQRVRTVQRA